MNWLLKIYVKPCLSLLLICFFHFISYGQLVKSFVQDKEGIKVTLEEGKLSICPLTENAIRVRFIKNENDSLPELIFTNRIEVQDFKVEETPLKIELKTTKVKALVDKRTAQISFIRNTGSVFLSEKAGTRKLIPDSVQGEPCFVAEQSFDSPDDERLFGLGQFQDGNFNLKGITRRLIQVNSQIALPFIYSNKGFGLLWHQYGLTDFNPADNFITLEKEVSLANGNHKMVEITTTSGTQKVSQDQSIYFGRFNTPKEGEYSIFLNLGDMGNRQFVTIDGKSCIDQTNWWLPPSVGTLVHLKAGEHQVQVVCKSVNTPKLSWKLTDNSTTFRSPHAKSLDYIVFYSPSADSVISTYRKLSGNVPMLPEWAYGFWQCRERYTSGKHLMETVKEFRNRNLPMDVIVQDWQYWGNNGWGVPKFDTVNYSNPSGFIKEIHNLHAHFNISIWSNPDKNSIMGKEFMAKNLYIPNAKWLDYFNPNTRKKYWNILNNNLFVHGVDSWWMDAVEPENDALKGEKTFLGAGDFYRLTYPLFVSQAVYEGQRLVSSDKRVCILTRSAFLGQQRYGIINWSGDIGGTWDSYKRQIVAGLNYSITGFPYWTTDIGGFFRPGNSQYTDSTYHELLTRWFQWGTFNPIFRVHGYQTETEPWKYGAKVEKNLRKMLNLRYRLLPYIYSEAWQVTKNGSTLMRPLVMDFRDDTSAISQTFEFMFGKSILVAPVTESGVNKWNIYLPKSVDWFNFWTGQRYNGGQTIQTEAPLNKIPLFVKAGTIIPMGKFIQYAGEKLPDTLEVRIYTGANAQLDLYEDEGDNYNYEKGNYTIISFKWNEKSKVLTVCERLGNYEGCLKKRIFNVVLVGESEGHGISENISKNQVHYSGSQVKVKCN